MQKLDGSFEVGHQVRGVGAACSALWAWRKRRSACLIQRAKGIRFSCRTGLDVEGRRVSTTCRDRGWASIGGSINWILAV